MAVPSRSLGVNGAGGAALATVRMAATRWGVVVDRGGLTIRTQASIDGRIVDCYVGRAALAP